MQNITNVPKEMLVEIACHLSIRERHQVFGRINKLFHSVVQRFVEEDKKNSPKRILPKRLDSIARMYPTNVFVRVCDEIKTPHYIDILSFY